ncbi:MAG: hypothetical protein JWQ22_3319, partial [Devosia sp.]|nr:hypothetical protein [Devosia sp.]
MLRLITVLTFTTLLPATGNVAPAFHDTLLHYMAEKYENRIELKANVDRDATTDLCPLKVWARCTAVTQGKLRQVYQGPAWGCLGTARTGRFSEAPQVGSTSQRLV